MSHKTFLLVKKRGGSGVQFDRKRKNRELNNRNKTEKKVCAVRQSL